MRRERFSKELPVPEFLNEKILLAAADFAAHRRKRLVRRKIFFGAAAAVVLVAASSFLMPRTKSVMPVASGRQDVVEWSTLDQESFVLSAELNSCRSLEEEFAI